MSSGEGIAIVLLLILAIVLIVGVGYIAWMASAALCLAWGVAPESIIWVQLLTLLFAYGIAGSGARSCRS